MLEIDIPGYGMLQVSSVLSDFNGTLACDGQLIPQITPLLRKLCAIVDVHVITADTYGFVAKTLQGLPVQLSILPSGKQDERKVEYLAHLGAEKTVAIGNGRNDRLMLKKAALGIAILETEGCCVETLQVSDIVCRSPLDAINLLLNPKRLIATLRT